MKMMEKAQQAAKFKKPDIAPFIPKGMEDTVQRVAAAGMKLLYGPDMRQEVMQAVQAEGPVAQKLGQNVTGLVLMLDQKSQGGIPAEAMFPAAMELLGEAAEMLSASGQSVTQEDFNDAAMQIMVELARRMGADDEQIMQAAQGAMQGGEQEPDMQDPAEGGEQEQMA